MMRYFSKSVSLFLTENELNLSSLSLLSYSLLSTVLESIRYLAVFIINTLQGIHRWIKTNGVGELQNYATESLTVHAIRAHAVKLLEKASSMVDTIANSDQNIAQALVKDIQGNRYFYGLHCLEIAKTLLLSSVILFVLCRCDFELTAQIFRFKRAYDRKEMQVQKLYDNLHRIYFCQISNNFKFIINNVQEQKVFALQFLGVSLLHQILDFRVQTLFNAERNINFHSIATNAFLLLCNGNDLFLPVINCFAIISLEFLRYRLLTFDTSSDQDLYFVPYASFTEHLCQLFLAFAIINFFAIQQKDKIVSEQQRKLNQSMAKSINQSINQQENVIITQFQLAKSETESVHGMSLIAAKNIIYQQISALHGYHVDEKSKMRSFLNQVTAQVLFNDRKMFENHNFLACYGGCHDIYIDRNEMSVTDFLKTFSKFDIEIDQINSFLFHNLRTSFSQSFLSLSDLDRQNFPEFENYEASCSLNFELQNNHKLTFDFDKQLNILTGQLHKHPETAETVIAELIPLSKEEEEDYSQQTPPSNLINPGGGTGSAKNIIQINNPTIKIKPQRKENIFQQMKLQNFQDISEERKEDSNLEYSLEEMSKKHEFGESSEFEKGRLESSNQTEGNVIKRQGNVIKRSSTNEVIRLFDEARLDNKEESGSGSKQLSFGEWTKLSSTDMKRKIWGLDAVGAPNQEPISSILNSNSERIKNRRDSSNPSTTVEQQAEQKISELQNSSFLISTGRGNNDSSIQQASPNYDSSGRIQQDANQQQHSINQLNQEIENEDFALEEFMHEGIMKTQRQLKNNRLFMDMVIHDMRNPTMAIQLNIQEIFQMLKTQQNKAQWIKNQRNLNMMNLKSSSSQLINMVSSSYSLTSVILTSNQSGLIRYPSQKSQVSNQRSQQIDMSVAGSNSKSQSGSELEEEKDSQPSLIIQRAVQNMNYSNPSQEISPANSNVNSSSLRRSENQNILSVKNSETQSALENWHQLQQLTISSNKLAQLNQINSAQNPNLVGFSDIMSARQKLFHSSNYHSKMSGGSGDSYSFVFSGYLMELYLISQGVSLLLLKRQKQFLKHFLHSSKREFRNQQMSQSGSFLSRALSQALQNEHKEKNIFLFINDLFLHDKIKVNSKIEMESMSEALGSSEEQKSIELEQIPQNQNASRNDPSQAINRNNQWRWSYQGLQNQSRNVLESQSDSYVQEESALIAPEVEQQIDLQANQNEEDFNDLDVDEMQGQQNQENQSQSNPRVFNNPVKFMKTKINQMEQIENDQVESIVKNIRQKLSLQLSQIDRHLALQEDQQAANPILRYWNGQELQEEQQIVRQNPLTELKKDFSALQQTLEKYQKVIKVRQEQIASNQVQQVIYQKPIVQTVSKGTQYQVQRPNDQNPNVNRRAPNRHPSQQQIHVARQLLRGDSDVRQGENSNLQSMSDFDLDSDRNVHNSNVQRNPKTKEQSIQCSMIDFDVTSQIGQLRVQNHLISSKMSVLAGYFSKLQLQNQDLRQMISSDQQKLQEQQKMIERYDTELQEIDNQESQNKKFLTDLIKFLQSTVFQSKMLNNLINDMLDLAKFESGTFKFHNNYFDLTEVVTQAFETFRHQAAKKGITLDFKIQDQRIKLDETMQNTIQDQPLFVSTLENRSIDSNQAIAQSQFSCLDFNPSGTSYASKVEVRNESDNQTDQSQIINSKTTSQDIKKYFTDIYGDKSRYLQIFLNLIGNSLHYTKEGQITVTFILLEEQDIKSKQCAQSLQQNQSQIQSNQITEIRAHDNFESNLSQQRSRHEELKQMEQPEQARQRASQNDLNESLPHSSGNSQPLMTLPAVQPIIRLNRQSTQEIRNSRSNEQLREQVIDYSNHLNSPPVSQNRNISHENAQNLNSVLANASNNQQNRYSRTEDLHQSAREGFSHVSSNNSKFITFRVEIKDTGVGIKQEDIPKLFTDFTRLDKNMNCKGTGLGLSICKLMVEKMGGSVDVQSVFGEGSTFRVTLSTKINTQPRLYTVSDSNKDNSDRNNDIEKSLINNLSSQVHTQNLNSSNTNQGQDSFKFQSSQHARFSNADSKRQYSMQMEREKDDIIKRGQGSSFTLSSGPVNLNRYGSQESSLSNQMIVSGQRSQNSRQSNGTSSEQRIKQSAKGSYHSQITVMDIQEVQNQQNQRQNFQSQPEILTLIAQRQLDGLASIHEENEMSSYVGQNITSNEESKEFESIQNRSQSRIQSRSAFDQIDENVRSRQGSDEQIEEQKSSSAKQKDEKQNSFGCVSFVNPFQNELSQQSKQSGVSFQNVEQPIVHRASQDSFGIDSSQIHQRGVSDENQSSNPSPLFKQSSIECQFKCLVANDTDFLLMANTQVLETCQMKVTSVINGLEAYEMISQEEQWFDVIILDLNMPIMDGFMAATKILSHFNNKDRYFPDLDSFNQKNENSNEGMKSKIKEYYRSAIVRRQSNSRDISVDEGSPHALGQSINDVMAIKPLIVACSNLMNDSIKQQCKEAGFDICLQQPLTVSMVQNQILNILQRAQPRQHQQN